MTSRADRVMTFYTEAGKRLAAWSAGDEPVPPDDWLGAILDIETEAAQEIRDDIRARVERDVLPLIVGTESEVRAGLAVLRMVDAAISSSSATETQDGERPEGFIEVYERGGDIANAARRIAGLPPTPDDRDREAFGGFETQPATRRIPDHEHIYFRRSVETGSGGPGAALIEVDLCELCGREKPDDRDRVVERELRDALFGIRDYGYQPRYNGRPSCPFCQNFIDDEETHRPYLCPRRWPASLGRGLNEPRDARDDRPRTEAVEGVADPDVDRGSRSVGLRRLARARCPDGAAMTDEQGLRALLERFIDFSDGSARYITDRRIPQAMPASCRSAALKLRARLSTPAASDGSLDVAWAAAEAALPEGTYIESVRRGWFETPVRYWVRTFRPIHGHNTETRDWPDGPTPIAALARLSESPSEGKTE